MKRGLVLLVDDEIAVLRSTAMLLSDMEFDVLETGEHTEVLALARRHRPDVILQDVRMPGLDLPALIQQLRADSATSGIPIVLFSASMDLDEVAVNVGAADAIEKPFRPRDLMAVIARATAPR